MSLTKQLYEKSKVYDDYEIDHYEIISYNKGYDKSLKKSSLKNGGVLDLTCKMIYRNAAVSGHVIN